MRTKILTALLCLFIFAPQLTIANICLESGTYRTDRVDFPGIGGQSSLFALPLKRAYNSSAAVPGMFGRGWSTSYSTTLTLTANGIIVIQDGGTGKKSFYAPDLPHNAFGKTTDQPIALLQNNCLFAPDIDRQDTVARDNATKTANHFKWRLGCVNGQVKKDADGFQRIRANITDFFDLKGRLYKAINNKGGEIVIHRNDKGQITKVSDNNGCFLTFEYTLDGLVASATRGDKTVAYQYEGKNLTLAKVDADAHRYSYNEEGRLVEISINETVSANITYDTEGRTTFIEQDGNRLEVFQYLAHDSLLLQKGFSHGTINTVYKNKQLAWQDITFYTRETNNYGIDYLSHRLGETRRIKHETTYQGCGLPTTEWSGKSRTSYQYNNDCQLVELNDGWKIKKFDYEAKHKKISQVTTTYSKTNQTTWSRFTYDSNGNLIHGKTSEKAETYLTYGPYNQVASMKNKTGQVAYFEYNAAGKPTLIRMADIGRLDIAYDKDGEVVSVIQGEGNAHKVATTLNDVIQDLLSIVKPAGINIGM